MPNVGVKKFPYTKEGMKQAEKARKRKRNRRSPRKDMNGNTYE
jgi:hypothetical protein